MSFIMKFCWVYHMKKTPETSYIVINAHVHSLVNTILKSINMSNYPVANVPESTPHKLHA